MEFLLVGLFLVVALVLGAGMLPTRAVRLALGESLAADAAILAPPALANEMFLIAADFVATENLAIGDLTAATFTGSTPLNCGVGAQQAGVDPATGEQLIALKSPAGGWRWECTVAPSPVETIFGYGLSDDGATTLLAVAKFDTPIAIAAVGDAIDLGAATLRFVAQPIS